MYYNINMPVVIANSWNALREGISSDENGNKFFTGNIIITFWLDSKVKELQTYFTNATSETESQKNAEGVIVKYQAKNDKGELVFDSKKRPVYKYFKVSYEHQVVVKKVTRVTSGFDGWSATLPDGTVICLPKGRGLMKEVIVEPTEAELETKRKLAEKNENLQKEEVQKKKLVRVQEDNILSAIFTVK